MIVCLAAGVRPWKDGAFDPGNFYALIAFALSASVMTAILSEFFRGAGVIARQTGQNLASMYLLTRRNTRRYGGYIIHIGVVIVVIGLAGAAFNRNTEQELALHDKMSVGPYTLEALDSRRTRTPTTTPTTRCWMSINGKKQFQMAPEKRVYLVSEQPQTMVAVHSVPSWDLYVVYEGTNPDTGQPIIKAFLNPLVSWIWAGVVLIVLGTFVALVPSLKPATTSPRLPAARPEHTEAVLRVATEMPTPLGLTFWKRAVQAGALAVVVCFSLGATRCRYALRKAEPPDDVQLRMRAGSGRVQPRGLSGFTGATG